MLRPTASAARQRYSQGKTWGKTRPPGVDCLRSGSALPPSAHPRRPSHPDCRCAGETSEEQAVQVRHDEGAAIRIDPEPCVGLREENDEASAGACTGQPLSRENGILRVPTRSTTRKATRAGCVIASARPTRRGRRPWHVQKLFVREPGDLGFGLRWTPQVRNGKTRRRSR